MRILDTANKKNKAQKWFVLGILLILALSGCNQSQELDKARNYSMAAQKNYEQAVKKYLDLAAKNSSDENLRFELGRLYYSRGEFDKSIEQLKSSTMPQAKKILAISYYRNADYASALDVFTGKGEHDDEFLYYWGSTCEKLNLFDKALSVYAMIGSAPYKDMALARINSIENKGGLALAKDLDSLARKVIAAAPDEKNYPQAGALILFCDEKVEITAQNTSVSSLHYIIKIINERGKEEFAETQIGYDSTYERVELEYARVIKPDGTVAEVGSRHIRDVSRYLNFPLYSNARVFIISFPEVAEGSVIEYKAKVYSNYLVNKKDYVTAYPVQSAEPILQAYFSISLPSDRQIHIKLLNQEYNNFSAKLQPAVSKDAGLNLYAWSFKNVPQIIPESSMPPDCKVNPAILISTFDSWKAVYDWWWPLAKDKINADKDIKAKVKELIKGAATEEAKARAIYNYCAQKIRYVAVEYGQAGYEPHAAELVFRNKYGDCKDKAILLITMLKEAGISAWPVLIPTKELYDLNGDFPTMYFNHAICMANLGGKDYILDPTAETCSFADLPPQDQDRGILVIKENTFEIRKSPLFEPGHNLVKQLTQLKVNNDESINVNKQVFVRGEYDQAQRYWLLYTPPELIEESLKERIQSFSIGAKLIKYDIQNLGDLNTPVVLTYEFSGQEYFTRAGLLRIMPQLTGIDTSIVAKAQRKYPIEFISLDSKENILELQLPAGFKVKYLPQSIAEESPWLDFSAEYRVSADKISFVQKNKVKKPVIGIGEYAQFKQFYESLAKKIKQRVVLEASGI